MKNIEENEFNIKIQKNLPVLIEFGSEWCGPCKKMRSILEELEEELSGKVEIYFFDISKFPVKAMEYEILSIPQMLFFKNGALLERVIGEQNKENLKKLVERYI